MLLTHKKTQPATVVLNDLIMINNERIACYRQAMTQTSNIDSDLRALFEDIIRQADGFKSELKEQLQQFSINPRDKVTISGMIHMAWQDLKATLKGNTRNATISFCLYNEEVALQAYGAALNLSDDTLGDIQVILERQHALLNDTYNLVKKNRQLLHYPGMRLMYFN